MGKGPNPKGPHGPNRPVDQEPRDLKRAALPRAPVLRPGSPGQRAFRCWLAGADLEAKFVVELPEHPRQNRRRKRRGTPNQPEMRGTRMGACLPMVRRMGKGNGKEVEAQVRRQ